MRRARGFVRRPDEIEKAKGGAIVLRIAILTALVLALMTSGTVSGDEIGKVKSEGIIWNTGKFILDHLTVGVDYKGGIGGTASTRRYYEDQGYSPEEAQLLAMYSALQAASRPAPGGQTILNQPGQGQPVIVLPSQAQPATGNVVSTKLILYAAVGVGVLLIVSRMFKK